MAIVHQARLSPLSAVTTWRLEDGRLIEQRGARERSLPLADLRRLDVADAFAIAAFRGGRMRIAARSFTNAMNIEDRSATFRALIGALAAEGAAASPRLRLSGGRGPTLEAALVWIMALCAAGAAAVLLSAAVMGAFALGLALASRLAFVLILALAVWPWLQRRNPAPLEGNAEG